MNLKQLRKRAGLRQVEAAVQLRVSQSAVSQWETGGCKPRADLLPKMVQLYRCTADELLAAPESKTVVYAYETDLNGLETEGNK